MIWFINKPGGGGHMEGVIKMGKLCTYDDDGQPINCFIQNGLSMTCNKCDHLWLKNPSIGPSIMVSYKMNVPLLKYDYISDEIELITGYNPDDFYNDPSLFGRLIHSDCINYFRQKWNEFVMGIIPPFYKFKVVDIDGNIHRIYQVNKVIMGSNGVKSNEGIIFAY